MQASHRVPYQGFPYSNPPVNDAPSVDPAAAAAARWAHLPRRQVERPVQRTAPQLYINIPDGAGSSAALPRKPVPTEDPEPVVYIDMPEAGGSYVSTTSEPAEDNDPPSLLGAGKRDPPEPVVYIDMPTTGSELTTHSEERAEEPEFVQETIFFNPFENRRMRRKDSDSAPPSPAPTGPPAPARPTTLDLYGAGSSGAGAGSSSGSAPGLMSKQTMVYGESFPMSPIPVSEFPEPPPSYAEIDRVSSPVMEPQEAVTEQPRPQEQPRTQVILPRDVASTPIGLPNSERKYLNCHHCGMRVHSLVIRENGTITHCIAAICLIVCMLPCVAFIYCTDAFKIKNHYCPSCNKIIGYELPFGKKKIVYVN